MKYASLIYIPFISLVITSCSFVRYDIDGKYFNIKYQHTLIIKDSIYEYRIGNDKMNSGKFEYLNGKARFYDWKSQTACGGNEDVGLWSVPFNGKVLKFSPDESECDFIHL